MDNERRDSASGRIFFPSLLDRLCDDQSSQAVDALERRALTWEDLRNAVIRDLTSLFNAARSEFAHDDAVDALVSVRDSVLGYGLPALAGKLASDLDFVRMAEELRQIIRVFEPRLIHETLHIEPITAASKCAFNLISFKIEGQIRAHPVPLEIALRTDLDLESGQVQVVESAGIRA